MLTFFFTIVIPVLVGTVVGRLIVSESVRAWLSDFLGGGHKRLPAAKRVKRLSARGEDHPYITSDAALSDDLEYRLKTARLEVDTGLAVTPALSGETCPHCQTPIALDADYCATCGAQVSTKPVPCEQCATINTAGATYCVKCGKTLPPRAGPRRLLGKPLPAYSQDVAGDDLVVGPAASDAPEEGDAIWEARSAMMRINGIQLIPRGLRVTTAQGEVDFFLSRHYEGGMYPRDLAVAVAMDSRITDEAQRARYNAALHILANALDSSSNGDLARTCLVKGTWHAAKGGQWGLEHYTFMLFDRQAGEKPLTISDWTKRHRAEWGKNYWVN